LAGIPKKVKEYEEGIKNGGIMMGAIPRNADAAYGGRLENNRGEQVYR
jgi:hypothetical protein